MSEAEQAPFIQLAKEEAKEHNKERALMEKAQKPNQVWQPMRRCQMVLDRLSGNGFSNIFFEPVDLKDFPDYEEIVDYERSSRRRRIRCRKILPVTCEKIGTTARCTISTDLPFGSLLTTCPSNLSALGS
jgi:hypothetical protein